MKASLSYGAVLFAGMAIGAATVWFLSATGPVNPTETAIKICGGAGNTCFELSSKGDAVDYERVLESMFEKAFLRAAATSWLASNQDLFPLKDTRLPDAIEERLCDPIPLEPRAEMLAKGKECARLPVASRLREMAFAHKIPFHYVGFEARVGVPRDGPVVGKANVCQDGGLLGKRIQVATLDGSEVIEVEASGYYVCTPAVPFPDIQLNIANARELFGGRPLAQTEDVVLVPLN